MSSKKIGLAIIGTGMAAKPHALALNELKDDINVVGVFSRNKEKRENFSKNYNFNSFQDIDSIYDNPEVDMVDIITPPNQRLELVEQFSKHGKHILMEKPIERTLENAKSIVSICENNKVNLGIVFQHRFRKSSIKLKSLINENKFGQIFSAQINIPWWREQSYYDEPGRGTYKRDGGGVLISQAIHTLDLAISLLGDVKDVMVMAETTKFHKMESLQRVFFQAHQSQLFFIVKMQQSNLKQEHLLLIGGTVKKKSLERNLELAVVLILWLFHLIGIKILYLILQNQLIQIKNLKLLEKKH